MAVQHALRLLEFMPRLGRPGYPGVRTWPLKHFPYTLVYRVKGRHYRDGGRASEQGAGVLAGAVAVRLARDSGGEGCMCWIAHMAIGSSTASTVRCQVKAAAPQPIAGGGDEASVYRRAQGAQCHGQHLIDCDRMEPEIHDGRRWRFAVLKNEIAEIGVEGEQYTRLGARQRQHPAIVEAG